MMRFSILMLLSVLAVSVSFAQPTTGLIAYYSFDNCDATDDTGNGSTGNVSGNPTCECGVAGNALRLDGIDDYITFTGVINNVFTTGDFTLSFYFKGLSAGGLAQDLFSKRLNCNNNTMLNLEYIHSLSFIGAELIEAGQDNAFISGNSDNACWHHVALTRDNQLLSLYINGELKQQVTSNSVIDLNDNTELTFGNSPCIGSTIARFRGLIDEVRVYNLAYPQEDIDDMYFSPDMIGTRDTIVFEGNSIETFTTSTCATSFSWTPADDVAEPDSGATTITPDTSGTYTLTFTDSDGCVTSDTLHIDVIDPSELDCNQLFLPKAFTPNGDLLNDEFLISNPQVIAQLTSFDIYDRWGNRVFTTNDPFAAWDGTYNGTAVNPGVFIYKIVYRCENSEQTETGTVTIIR